MTDSENKEKTVKEFLEGLPGQDVDYMVIAYALKDGSGVQVRWGDTTNANLVYASSYLDRCVKDHVFSPEEEG